MLTKSADNKQEKTVFATAGGGSLAKREKKRGKKEAESARNGRETRYEGAGALVPPDN